MNNALVLLTKKFPFDRGEEFIENEIPVLAGKFDKIIVIATSVGNKPVQTRGVPAHTEVRYLKASSVRRAIPTQAASLFLRKAWREYLTEEERKRADTAKKKLFLLYFLSKVEGVYQGCSKILKDALPADCEAVTFYSYWLYDTAAAAVSLKKSYRTANSLAVSRAHRYDLYDDQNPAGYLPLRTFLLQGLDKVFPCSQDGTDYLNRLFPGFSEKIETSYLGTNDFGLSPGNGGETFRLVSCCHVSPVKRVDLLAKALAGLENSGLKLQWTHFGGGDGLQEIKDYAENHLGFMETRFAGEIKNRELMEYYGKNSVDCFVNTSSSEGLPVSIMEACSFGIPVIATDVGGTSEIVRDRLTGFLAKPDCTPEDLSALIVRIASLPDEEKNAMRAAARKIWTENFSSQVNYTRFAETIQVDTPR